MTDETLYTIGQLAELAGVTPRTIRYYTGEGLLPRPDSRGQYALYGPEHLLRLQLIARLKEAFLPLGEIKVRLDQLSTDQIRELLAGDESASEPPASSASEYLATLLSRQQIPAPGAKQIAEEQASYAAPAQAAFKPQQRLAASEPPAPAPAQIYGFIGPAAPAPPEPSQAPGLLRRLLAHRQSAEPAGDMQEGESWLRIPLAPGVELHVRQPIAAQLQERLDALIAFAKHTLGGD